MNAPATLTTTRAFLAHLHRGGRYSYWWTSEGRQSTWWDVSAPAPIPGGQRNVYFGVHPVTAIPATNRRGQAADPEQLRGQIAHVAALNCLYGDFDAKDFGGDKARALAHVEALDPPASVIVDSGGGYHGYWLLAEP